MRDIVNQYCITNIAASLADAMGIPRPVCAEEPLSCLAQLVQDRTAHGKVDRLLMYNPDAVAQWLWQKYSDYFTKVCRYTQLSVPLHTVMPSVTPVCFGSLYTGAQPAVHGIRAYEKPVIRIDTLFDTAIRAGKKCAIVADTECSIGRIFRERKMDYFVYQTVYEINNKAEELIEKDEYDIIVVYNGDYDHEMHHYGPESLIPMKTLRLNTEAFARLAQKANECWKKHDTLIGFAMDHGCHEIDGGCGSHGLDMPEDLNIVHMYGVFPREAD